MVICLVFLGFCTITPIDSIIQSKERDRLAINTFIVLGACVLFALVSLIIYTVRIYVIRRYLADIPKSYIPHHERDLPQDCLKMIAKRNETCQHIRELAKPNVKIKHPGLSYEPNSPMPYVIYRDLICLMGEQVRYTGKMSLPNQDVVNVPQNLTLREIFYLLAEDGILKKSADFEPFLRHYEYLRFSDEPIKEKDFFKFLAYLQGL